MHQKGSSNFVYLLMSSLKLSYWEKNLDNVAANIIIIWRQLKRVFEF
jgi:hypothetical protein